MRFKIHKLFDDPTEGRIINNRLFNGIFSILQNTTIGERDKENLIHLLSLICKKLIGVRKHIDKYKECEVTAKNSASESRQEDGIWEEIELSDDLFLEFDGFLVQVKSTLDYLVKVPNYIVGKKYWGLGTFGEKGRKVAKAIKNLPKEHQAKTKGFSDYLVDRHKLWLDDAINARDKINHFLDGGVDCRIFCITKERATGVIRVPMWSPDQSIFEFMEIIWSNLFRYCEDFWALFLSLKLSQDLSVVRDNDVFPEPVNPWKVVVTGRFEAMLRDKNLSTHHIGG